MLISRSDIPLKEYDEGPIWEFVGSIVKAQIKRRL
jgi:hypothetical protein